MPQKRAAYKELRKSAKKHLRNLSFASEVKTSIKKYNSLLAEKKFDQAKEILPTVYSKLHKAASRGLIHKNTASRKIFRLSKKLNQSIASKK